MFMDCPKCGSEFVTNDAEIRRCPDCLQWLDLDLEIKDYYGKSYKTEQYDTYDEDNYAYDY